MDQTRYDQLLMLRNVRDKERYATMSDEQKNEKNKKRREARLRNKELNKKRPEASQRNNCQNMMPNAPRGDEIRQL